MKNIVIATKNKGKAKEFQSLFQPFHVQVLSLLDLSFEVPDIKETGTTFEENAKIKAEKIASILQTTVLADDSGLIIDALGGRPGVYSARYAGESSSDQDNINKVMNEMNAVLPKDRTARFVSVIAVAVPGQQTFFRKGTCEGEIALTESGTNGFGYDPIFIPVGYKRTMAELSAEEKNNISHRTNALAKLEDWLASNWLKGE
ncbi:XTP/dITP diphosphatase [Virgibacillus sp. W0181]|uniref:XTP/dITP diphosphatase n=1 Tax=Virgibacillus sp. W0181 TaxID=3391581 RepID=UPI003F4500C1